MGKQEKSDDLLAEAKARTRLLTENLPRRVDPASISVTAKIPFKVIAYREALIWRTEELARIACEMYERSELASAMILTRSCTETIAAMWYLKEKIQIAIDSKEVGDIDDILMRLLMGSKNNTTNIDAINVLTFVETIDKDFEGEFSENYKILCEYTHPNWSGTSFLYSKPNIEKIWTDFGKNVRDNTESVAVVGLLNLTASLNIFEYSYTKVGDLMPDFINICEEALASRKPA